MWFRTKWSPKREPQAECGICLEQVYVKRQDGTAESWSYLLCGHRFGSRCIQTWLSTEGCAYCPLCREPAAHACGDPIRTQPWKQGSLRETRPPVFRQPSGPGVRSRECGFCCTYEGRQFESDLWAVQTLKRTGPSAFRGFPHLMLDVSREALMKRENDIMKSRRAAWLKWYQRPLSSNVVQHGEWRLPKEVAKTQRKEAKRIGWKESEEVLLRGDLDAPGADQ